MRFTRDDMILGLTDLGHAAATAGKIIDLSIYGGSCLMLVSNFRLASQDVDAVVSTDQAFVDRLASEIAERRGWPRDWLNDGVRTYLSPNVDAPDDLSLAATYPDEKTPGVRVYVPTPEYMLAMKLMALRIGGVEGEKDRDDILALIAIVRCADAGSLIALAARYYPEARVSSKLRVAAASLVAMAQNREINREAPRYLDRGGGGEPAG